MNGFDKVIGYDAIKLEIARLCDVIKIAISIKNWVSKFQKVYYFMENPV